MYEIEDDNLYELEKKATISIIQEDMESIYSLMLTEKDSIFCMAIIPYYALFVQACQEYMDDVLLPDVEARRVKDIRNHIKAYGEKIGKTRRRIQDINYNQDKQFREKLKFDFMKQMNKHMNLGTYWTQDKHIVGNTQLYADYLEVDNVFDSQCGKRQLELGYQMGRFVKGVKEGFEKCIYQPVIERKKQAIEIEFYADLNTNSNHPFFVDNSSKELNLLLLHLLCNMNFVKYILREMFAHGNIWVFRVDYIVAYYTYRALQRLKNYCKNNNDMQISFIEYEDIFTKGDILFQSKFRNCMMHYGLENRAVLSYEHIQNSFFGMVETCFAGMNYQAYTNNLRELSDIMISFLEKRFDVSKIKLSHL